LSAFEAKKRGQNASAIAIMALAGRPQWRQPASFEVREAYSRVAQEATIRQAAGDADIALARTLFGEYARLLGIDLSYQGFEAELAGLPGDYAPPQGALLLAIAAEDAAGCVAMRRLAPDVCEMKRLYVRPRWRRHGIGRQLIDAILAEARRAGYREIRLDTLPNMTAARAIYESLGFRAISPYYPSPIAGTAFLELDLTGPAKTPKPLRSSE
jgi:putative acetyltransferase